MKLLKLSVSVIIVIASIILCQQIISNSMTNQQYKNDYAELNHIKHGFLSIEEWKIQVTRIIEDEIDDMYLSKDNEQVLRKHIETLLDTLIDKVAKKIKESNAGTLKGWAARSFINTFIDDIKKGIPEYADAIIKEIKKPKTERQIKAALTKQLKKFSEKTFDTQDTSQLTRILIKTGSEDIETARTKINNYISMRESLIVKQSLLLIALAVILFAMSGFSKQPLQPSEYILLVLSLITLLAAGVTTPMIDMEATISQISFELLGHPVNFEDQVLYFQSKSILDVFLIMITHKTLQMKFVGVLLLTFSILFPVLKIVSSLVHYFNYHNARENRVIKFFVFNSGKWSMADVMVVAIFMAYIGFNGVITSQFGKLRSASEEAVVLTTNATALQPGFYLFLTYTLLALFLSGFLVRKPTVQNTTPVA